MARRSPGSARPTASRYSFCSSSAKTAISLSILAETITTAAPSSAARSSTAFEKLLLFLLHLGKPRRFSLAQKHKTAPREFKSLLGFLVASLGFLFQTGG